jgi:hypothetical protein
LAAYDSTVSSSLTVRPARVEDVAQMARVIVRCWQETYRGLMSDAVLDDPGLPAARERFWTAALTDEVAWMGFSGASGGAYEGRALLGAAGYRQGRDMF